MARGGISYTVYLSIWSSLCYIYEGLGSVHCRCSVEPHTAKKAQCRLYTALLTLLAALIVIEAASKVAY